MALVEAEAEGESEGTNEQVLVRRRGVGGATLVERSSMFLSIRILKLEKMMMVADVDGSDAAAFRNRMIVKGRGCTTDGTWLKFTPMIPNGNCGFLTVAVGANKVLKRKYSSYDIRSILCEEVRNNGSYYINESLQNPAYRYQMEDDLDLEKFEKSVMKTGWSGHWLGEKWGMLEIKSIARALKLNIEVFCHDVKTNSLRSYHQEKYGDKFVGMFFSGVSTKGHFDLLVKDRKSKVNACS